MTAFQTASGFVDLVPPTSAALSKVGYDRYPKFAWPFPAAVFVTCCAFVGIAAATS